MGGQESRLEYGQNQNHDGEMSMFTRLTGSQFIQCSVAFGSSISVFLLRGIGHGAIFQPGINYSPEQEQLSSVGALALTKVDPLDRRCRAAGAATRLSLKDLRRPQK